MNIGKAGGATFAAVAMAVLSVRAVDWTMYRGPNGDGVCTERIQMDWPAPGPKKLWSVQLTNGLSSVTASAGRLFTQVRQGNTEYAVALNADTGGFLWVHPVWTQTERLSPDGGVGSDDGPRTTPVVVGEKVVVLSSYLSLHCLEAVTGKEVWSRDLQTELGGTIIDWQNAASPLLVGDLLLLNVNAPGGTLAALRVADGSIAWQRHHYALTHATPVRAEINGLKQAIFFTQEGLVGVDVANGREIWQGAFSFSISTAASPVVDGEMVFCSAAYNRGAALFALVPLFSKNEGTDKFGKFYDTLVKSTDDVSNYLRPRFANDGIPLNRLDPPSSQAIIDELNRLMLSSSGSFYEDSKVGGVSRFVGRLSPTTEGLLSTNPTGPDLVLLNRMLLEDCYAELPRNQKVMWTMAQLWKSGTRMRNHWSTSVVRANHIYGLHEGNGSPLKCIELKTGVEKWRADGFGFGATLVVNDKIFAVTEDGKVVVIEPDPERYRELSRFQAIKGRVWNSPAISNGRLYIRGTTELAAFDVSLPAPQPLKLLAVSPGANGRLRLTVTSSDGQPVSADRTGRIELLSSATPASPLTDWARLNVEPAGLNGMLQLELPLDATTPQRYFRVRENP